MRLSVKITFILSLLPLYAANVDELNMLMRTKQMSLYGVKNKDNNTTNGMGLFYNTQTLKLKAEGSDTSFKTGALVHLNPFQTPVYLNIGANYIDEKIQANDSRKTNISQYSSALAIGYMLYNDLNLELGGNFTRSNGSQNSEDTALNSQITKDTYIQLGKRFETPIGTIDTHVNGSQIYNTLTKKEENYESNVNYYFNDAIKLGYLHTINQNEISNGCSLGVSYFSTAYTKNSTQDSYDFTVGVKANFTDITDFSTYKPSGKVKKRLSKSNKFDNIILHNNMHLH